jgi:hypothetical protein
MMLTQRMFGGPQLSSSATECIEFFADTHFS